MAARQLKPPLYVAPTSTAACEPPSRMDMSSAMKLPEESMLVPPRMTRKGACAGDAGDTPEAAAPVEAGGAAQHEDSKKFKKRGARAGASKEGQRNDVRVRLRARLERI